MVQGAAQVRNMWPDILEAVKNRRRFTWILLSQNAQVTGFDGATLQLGFLNAGARDTFSSSGSEEVLKQALAEQFNAKWKVDAVVDPSGGGGGGQPAPSSGGGGRPPAAPYQPPPAPMRLPRTSPGRPPQPRSPRRPPSSSPRRSSPGGPSSPRTTVPPPSRPDRSRPRTTPPRRTTPTWSTPRSPGTT